MMGRLFWKIFLGFWLTLTISGGIVGTIVWKNNEARIQNFDKLRGFTKETYSLNFVARILRTNGVSFLQQFGDTNSLPFSLLTRMILNYSDERCHTMELVQRVLTWLA